MVSCLWWKLIAVTLFWNPNGVTAISGFCSTIHLKLFGEDKDYVRGKMQLQWKTEIVRMAERLFGALIITLSVCGVVVNVSALVILSRKKLQSPFHQGIRKKMIRMCIKGDQAACF